MSFYRETIIRKPIKAHVCELCGKYISGEHVYVVGNAIDFGYYRAHIKCHEAMTKECLNCYWRGDCQYSVFECFSEKLLDRIKK